jgi:alkylation response protein AidB-like acyl-CoA dehydrogenase
VNNLTHLTSNLTHLTTSSITPSISPRTTKGIRVGDCGTKFGRNGLDNGFIQFTHVKIPRSHMLCKYAAVDAAGGYSQRGRKQLQYGALIGGRAIMVTDSAIWYGARFFGQGLFCDRIWIVGK